MPPRRTWPNSSSTSETVVSLLRDILAPSATTTMEKRRPRLCRLRMWRTTSVRSMGRSGTRITSAPPAIPEWSAMCPAWRPITSQTMTRLWASAVEWSRSMASVAMVTAVSNPKV